MARIKFEVKMTASNIIGTQTFVTDEIDAYDAPTESMINIAVLTNKPFIKLANYYLRPSDIIAIKIIRVDGEEVVINE